MAEDHDDDRPEYEPTEPTPPEREPPLRSTAPQSAYSARQALVGFVVLLLGAVVVFGLPLLLA